MDDELTWGPQPRPAARRDDLLPSAAPPRRRGARAAAATGVGVLAAMVAGAFAVASLGAADGSETPEAAVERFFEAVSDEDALGALEALTPGERTAIRPGIEDVAAELQRIGVLGDELDLSSVGGVDLEVADLQLASERLGDGVAAVRVTGGTASAASDPASLPLGGPIEGLLGPVEGDVDAAIATSDLASGDSVLVAVEEGGGWHVSLFYSLAEAMRRDSGKPLPAFGQGVAPDGASSPEEAVREAVDAAVALDLRSLLALLPPDEARALHDYAPLFLAEAEDELGELGGTGITVERLELDSERDGDTARVSLREIEVRGTADGEPVHASFDGDCWAVEAGGRSESACVSDDPERAGVTGVAGATSVTTVERGGEWYVSPVRTTLDGVVQLLASVDPADLEGGLGSLTGGVLGPLAGLGPMAPIETDSLLPDGTVVPDTRRGPIDGPVGEVVPTPTTVVDDGWG